MQLHYHIPNMILTPVDSSNLAAIGFELTDPEMGDGELYVQFKTGHTFRYFQVPRERYKAFMAAESKGGYFSRFIRKKYHGEKVDDTPDVPLENRLEDTEYDPYGMPTTKVEGVKAKRTDERTCGRCGAKWTVGEVHICSVPQQTSIRTGSIDL